ncbi:SIMPL domain-containing protein [Neobacillus drentensis]|uniref:SIMPL domain-containing protein n=1 Tax=Neobacillus drentensis TaxID=220684 RepID=UPI002FFDE69D
MYPYHVPTRNGLHPKGQLIKVIGEGELLLSPDSASVNLGVITEMKELIPAQQQNSVEMTKVINALKALGVPQNSIQTTDFRIDTEYDYEQGKQIFRGYKVIHTIKVKIDDLSLVGKIVDSAVQNGVNSVSNVQFSLKNEESYYLQALALALNNASEKAKTIAATLHVTLNPTPNTVVESSSSVQPIHFPVESLAKGFSSTHLEPGQLKVKAVISAEFHYHTTA